MAEQFPKLMTKWVFRFRKPNEVKEGKQEETQTSRYRSKTAEHQRQRENNRNIQI